MPKPGCLVPLVRTDGAGRPGTGFAPNFVKAGSRPRMGGRWVNWISYQLSKMPLGLEFVDSGNLSKMGDR